MYIPSIKACRNGYESFAEKYPKDCWLKGDSEDGSETYMIRKATVIIEFKTTLFQG